MDNEADANISQTISFSKASHSDHNKSEEACNPFCSCMCCNHVSAPVFAHTHLLTANNKEIIIRHSFYKNVSLSSDFFGNIWQPPKAVI